MHPTVNDQPKKHFSLLANEAKKQPSSFKYGNERRLYGCIELNASYIRIGTALFGRETLRTKIEIFSSQKLENFFINLENFYDVSLKSYDELDGCSNSRNLSIVFIDHKIL